ncbi:hypothetical protein CIB48_g9033 [Xylaria polymorpha]|nr:hypothetical protein CIB48_g9033 [Xylaria polymorpha]
MKWMREFRDATATGKPTSAYSGHSGLLQLLRDTVGSESSDPRDKIFALVGLVRGLDLDGITPNYNLSYVQVYTGLATYFIKNHGLTELIMMGTHEDINLPSWVPDWRALRESDWTKLDTQPPDSYPRQNAIILQTASSILVNSLKLFLFNLVGVLYENLRPIMQTTNLPSGGNYKLEIDGQTGALIHTASCLFSFEEPGAEKKSSTVYTKTIWKTGQHNIVQLAIVTLKPVVENTDMIASLPGQKIYTHLRRTSHSTYRILGEAMVFFYEFYETPASILLPIRHEGGLDLFTDFVTIWCEKVSVADELWRMFIDPSGSSGIRAKFSGEIDIPCVFSYRIRSVGEAHKEYLSLKEEFEDGKGVLRRWISRDGQFTFPSVVNDLIRCILYWQEPHHWENTGPSLPTFEPIVKVHITAWVNTNTIWQRWLALEKALAGRCEMAGTCGKSWRKSPSMYDLLSLSVANESVEKVIETWKDLTNNLILRLNIISDATSLESFPIDNKAHINTKRYNQECEEFLNSIFTGILHDLYKMYKPRATDYDKAKVSSLPAESLGIPEHHKGLLGLPNTKECRYESSGFHVDDSRENATDKPCPICIDIQASYDTIGWKEHWRVPKSRSDIRKSIRALGIRTYGDRRRTALRGGSNSRGEAQVLGSLLDLSIKALRQEDIIII